MDQSIPWMEPLGGAQKCKCCHLKRCSSSSVLHVEHCGLFGKADFAPGSSQTLRYTSRTWLWRWEGANIPIRSAWRLLPARYVVSASSRAHFLSDSLDGTFPCAPGNSAAAVGIYFLKAALSKTSDTRGIHFLGLSSTARNMEAQLLSAAESTRLSRVREFWRWEFSECGLSKGCFHFKIIHFLERGCWDIKK